MLETPPFHPILKYFHMQWDSLVMEPTSKYKVLMFYIFYLRGLKVNLCNVVSILMFVGSVWGRLWRGAGQHLEAGVLEPSLPGQTFSACSHAPYTLACCAGFIVNVLFPPVTHMAHLIFSSQQMGKLANPDPLSSIPCFPILSWFALLTFQLVRVKSSGARELGNL